MIYFHVENTEAFYPGHGSREMGAWLSRMPFIATRANRCAGWLFILS